MRIFGQLLLVDKQKVPYLYKTTSKEFEFLHKILFKKMISLSIINYFDNFKEILWSQNF